MTDRAKQLDLLRNAVAAKLIYWGANRDLEKSLCGEDIDDMQAEDIEEWIETLASVLIGPHEVFEYVGMEQLDYLINATKGTA